MHPFLSPKDSTDRQEKINNQKKQKRIDGMMQQSPLRSLQQSYSPGRMKVQRTAHFESPLRRAVHVIFELIKILLLALIVIVPIRVFLFQPFFVKGASMEPNYSNGQYLLINELGYKTTRIGLGEKTLYTVTPFKKLQRGDVVVFRLNGTKDYFIKRIIGLPGETIRIDDGTVVTVNTETKNATPMDETAYLPEGHRTICRTEKCTRAVTLGPDEFYVLGDNRSASSDSREFGAVPREIIVGVTLLRAWPVTKFEIF